MAEPKAAPRWVVAHTGDLHYPSTRTGRLRTAHPREVIDDLPAQSVIDGVSGPNWVIGAGLVQPYTGDVPTGQNVPVEEAP